MSKRLHATVLQISHRNIIFIATNDLYRSNVMVFCVMDIYFFAPKPLSKTALNQTVLSLKPIVAQQYCICLECAVLILSSIMKDTISCIYEWPNWVEKQQNWRSLPPFFRLTLVTGIPNSCCPTHCFAFAIPACWSAACVECLWRLWPSSVAVRISKPRRVFPWMWQGLLR